MTKLFDRPVELDPRYEPVFDPADQQPRRPRVGEWVNCHHAVRNGPDGFRRDPGIPELAQVLEVRDGDYEHGGCLVRPWSQEIMRFEEAFFAPWCCILSRTSVTAYSLTGEMPEQARLF